MNPILATYVMTAIAGLVGAAPATPTQPVAAAARLQAFYRQGQTFITWTEVDDVDREQYTLYRSDVPITLDTLSRAVKMAVVAEGSGVYSREAGLKVLAKKTGIDGYGQRFIIRDNPTNDPNAQLPQGVGLFVRTIKQAGKRYYAVLPSAGGKTLPDRFAALPEPVVESVQLPGAVLVWKHPDGKAAVYTHFTDGETWDPSKEGNAYNFGAAVPADYDGRSPLPVVIGAHGMSGSYRAADFSRYWGALWAWPCDHSGSWFFGMTNREGTKVVNYTEQRVRWLVAWLGAERSNQFWRIDPRFVHGHGHSMGGTACIALALRMGDLFCTTVSSAGATIHRRNGKWVKQAEGLWGPVDTNLRTPDGTGVWDHQDYAQWSLAHIGAESAFLLLSHGKQDESVPFDPFPDFVDALQQSKRPFVAHWDQRGHGEANFLAVRNDQAGGFKIPIDQSLPAFANASNNDDPRKDGQGMVNGYLEWSAPGNDFDAGSAEDDLVDTPSLYAVNVRSRKGQATVDITPRRLQRFKPVSGKLYKWENIDFASPAQPSAVASGQVAADRYGLITVRNFRVGDRGWGNRLRLAPLP